MHPSRWRFAKRRYVWDSSAVSFLLNIPVTPPISLAGFFCARLVSSQRVLKQAACHTFYVRKKFWIRGCSLNQEWNIVSLHFEVERVAWTHGACPGGIAQGRYDQADVIGARTFGSDANVGAEILNDRIFLSRCAALPDPARR